MRNIDDILYTCAHKRAITYTIHKLVKDPTIRDALLKHTRYHDSDKLLLYSLIDPEIAHIYHREHANHHMENNLKKMPFDKIEAVFDYESAGYTKEDKPLNAYDFIKRFIPEHMDELLPIMETFKIATSYENTPDDPDWKAFNESLPEINETYAMAEIIQYIIDRPEQAKILFNYAKSIENLK